MSLIGAIKAERKLTLNHWRYKLLHWTFGCSDVTSKDDSKLPKYLYTHYCPLFHMTNLLLLVSPVTAVIRIVLWFLHNAVFPVLCAIGDLAELLKESFIRARRKAQEAPPKQVPVSIQRSRELKTLKKLIWEEPFYHDDFDYFWECNSRSFQTITEDEARRFHGQIVAAHTAWREAKERREAFFNRLISIGDFVGRILLPVMGIVLVVGIAFSLYLSAPYIAAFFVWCGNGLLFIVETIAHFCSVTLVNWLETYTLPILVVAAFSCAIVAALVGMGYSVHRWVWPAVKCVSKPPLMLAGHLACSSFYVFCNTISMVIEFCSDFYANNCPPITIVENKKKPLYAEDILPFSSPYDPRDDYANRFIKECSGYLNHGGCNIHWLVGVAKSVDVPESGVDDFIRASMAYYGSVRQMGREWKWNTMPKLAPVFDKMHENGESLS